MGTKIIIADDHKMVLDGLCALLENEESIEILTTAGNGEEVLKLVEQNTEIDLLVLDINMPIVDGIDVTKAIKAKYPEIKVLILSMYKKSEFIKHLVKAGADGYILKNSGRIILLEAINSLMRGERYYGKDILDTMLDDYIEQRPEKDMKVIELSEREKEVVRLIAQEKSTAEIAEALFLSHHTINSHRKSILNKLDVKNTAGIFRYAIQTGIIKGFDL